MFDSLAPRLALVGVLLMLVAAVEAVKTLRLQRRGVVVPGVVVRVDETPDSETPIVQFRDPAGTTRELRVAAVTGATPKTVGAPCRVRVDPEHPGDAQLDTPFNLWARAVFTLGVGMFLILVGALHRLTRG